MPFSWRFTARAGSRDLDVPGGGGGHQSCPVAASRGRALTAISPRSVLVAGTDTVAGPVAKRHFGEGPGLGLPACYGTPGRRANAFVTELTDRALLDDRRLTSPDAN
jgi:hypothetical protein